MTRYSSLCLSKRKQCLIDLFSSKLEGVVCNESWTPQKRYFITELQYSFGYYLHSRFTNSKYVDRYIRNPLSGKK